ncbi:MAG: YceI family protein [Coriobacteriia bacterium]|nr:YceI family protein [Coriobacteriia bacterium]
MASHRWTVDPTVSSVTFKIGHLAISKVRGTFTRWGGTLVMDDRGMADSAAEVWVETASVNTHEAARDDETRSERFLDVASFPRIMFRSTAVDVIDPSLLTMTGDLTLHGVTRPVRVEARYNGRAKDGEGRTRMGWEAELTVRREDFGLLWHPALEQVSGFLLGDEIEVTIDLEAVLEEPS